MNNLHEIKQKSDVFEVLQNFAHISPDFKGVLILGLKKDNGILVTTSSMTAEQKAFLTTFLNAWMVQQFNVHERPQETPPPS